MKQIYAFLAGTLIIFSSCSSTQRVSQTTDDVYYSGGPKGGSSGTSSDEQPEYYSTRPSDQYVRLKSQDYNKWSYFDDYNSYSPYYASSGLSMGMGMGYYPSYGYGLGFGGTSFSLGFGDPYMCWNSYYMWNSWYNPYFYNPYYGGGVIIVNPKGVGGGGTVYNHLRTFNGTSYRNVTAGTSGSDRFYRPASNVSTTQYNRNVRSGNGNTYRTTNTNNTTNSYRPTYNNNNSQPVRSYSPAPSFGGGGTRSVGGGGGGGFSRPGRN